MPVSLLLIEDNEDILANLYATWNPWAMSWIAPVTAGPA